MTMGGNPIRNNDILGDKWKNKSDEETAESTGRSIERKKNELKALAEKLTNKANKKISKGKEEKAKAHLKRVDEIKSRIDELSKAQAELGEMGSSETEFTFRKNSNELYGSTYMNSEGTVVIESGSIANRVHELAHAYQHLIGKIEYIPGKREEAWYVDVTDELEAYQRQFSFDPASVRGLNSDVTITMNTSEDITIDWVLNVYAIDNRNIKQYFYRELASRLKPINKPGSPADRK